MLEERDCDNMRSFWFGKVFQVSSSAGRHSVAVRSCYVVIRLPLIVYVGGYFISLTQYHWLCK